MAQKHSNPPAPAGRRPAPPPNPPRACVAGHPCVICTCGACLTEAAEEASDRAAVLDALGVVLAEARTLYALCGECDGAADAMARASDAARWYV